MWGRLGADGGILGRLGDGGPTPCGCEPSFDGDRLRVDATDCEAGCDLVDEPACRVTVVDAFTDRDADAVVVAVDGVERIYDGRGAALLVAAGRFVERAAVHDERLAERCRRDPLAAARVARGRAGVVPALAAEAGLLDAAEGLSGYGEAFRPHVAPPVMRCRIETLPPPGGTLLDRRSLSTGAVARVYDVDGRALRCYHLDVPELDLDPPAMGALASAHELLATGGIDGGERAPGRAVRAVADEATPVRVLARALRKHTRGLGVLADLFADDRVSDVYATSPPGRRPLRVVLDGEVLRSNVRLTESGAAALASRFRRESGRAFSRARPSLDASVAAGDTGIRVAGLTSPASDGVAFAFRADDAEPWTLPGLVANGTLPPTAAGLLSVAVDRGVSALIAGPRGAGKTTALDALLWELSPATRVVVIEDTPELSVGCLQRHGRDVQPVRTSTGEEAGLTPVEGLRTALRLGEGALVLGEVRGEEAAVLYEAMRVGASSDAVLGTIHGDGAGAVRDRVVGDLGVPPSSFAATDLVVTVGRIRTTDGVDRQLAAVEEVVRTDDGVGFEALFERDGERLSPTGRIARGESALLPPLAAPGESYADVRAAVDRRGDELERMAAAGLTEPGDLTDVGPE